MLEDLVLDTNIMLHAENEREPRRADAATLLPRLRDCSTKLCVDDGFDLNEARNRSHIGAEYLRHLSFGMLGFAVVAHLAASNRVKIVTRQVPSAISRKINMNVRSAPDRTYVRVAFNSDEKIFVSHDYGDIPQTSRDRLRAVIAVAIMEAATAVPQLD